MELLSFRLGAALYALPLAQVQEVVQEVVLAPLPAARPPLRGLLRLRGELLPALDAAPALGLPAETSPAAALVLETAGRRWALLVDAPGELVRLASAALPATGAAHGRAVVGFAQHQDLLLTVVDAAGLRLGAAALTRERP